MLATIERAKCLMLEQIDQPVHMEELAAGLNVGYSWFRRMFRHYTGLSPAQYHLQMRIQHGCELLGTTTLPIATIGQRSGFASAYYFSRIFREKMSVSPSEISSNRPSLDIAYQPQRMIIRFAFKPIIFLESSGLCSLMLSASPSVND